MKNMSLMKVLKSGSRYPKMTDEERKKLQEQRLKELVVWTRENSPYYKKLYQHIGDNFTLSELPPVNKVELMAHFNDWVTDHTVKLEDLNKFMENLDNIGRKYQGKYLVYTTSGSTGNPLVALSGKTDDNFAAGINILRAFARKDDMKEFIKRGGKTIGVFATGGFYLSNSSVRARLLKMPWKKKQVAVTSALLPTAQIVEELNAFQPTMLGGYPSNLELLIDEQQSGRLHIQPLLIMTGGEYLSEELRERLSKAFSCYVQTSYSCTEGGSVACECIKHHFHVNDDWIIVEPVDSNNQPVADGVRSDKILLTNLANYVQPFIRYEVTDRVVMHHEACGCGNRSPWLTLEGRTDDVVTFLQDGEKIRMAPLAIYATLKEIHEIQRFQMVAHKNNQVELRLIPKSGFTREAVFEKAKQVLQDYLATHGITQVNVTLSRELPQQHAKSGKFKHIVNE